MEKINELTWETLKGEKYPIAKTSVEGNDIIIRKYDEDSFSIIGNADNIKEVNLMQLEDVLAGNVLEQSNLVKIDVDADNTVDNTETPSGVVVPIAESIRSVTSTEIAKIDINNQWASIDGVGDNVIEIPHIRFPGCTLRIVKEGENSFKIAILGKHPNVNGELIYEPHNLRFAILNYASAAGIEFSIAEAYYNSLNTNE